MASTINSSTSNGIVITPDTSGEIELQANGVTKAKITANGLQDANGNSITGGMYRNLLINGDFNVWQRGTSFSPTSALYTADRFSSLAGGGFNIDSTVTQSTDVPTGQGFKYSLDIAVDTVQTPTGSHNGGFGQFCETQNFNHLAWGTSNAKSLTLSFWVKSNKTGTYACQFKQNEAGTHYYILKEYTIDVADTWEKKTITISGNTAQSFDAAATSDGFRMMWWLATGPDDYVTKDVWTAGAGYKGTSSQVNLWDNAANYWRITGVQLEVGSGASDFEFLPDDVQLARCQRYYEKSYEIGTVPGTASQPGMSVGYWSGAAGTNMKFWIPFKVTKRTSPTLYAWDYAGNQNKCSAWNAGAARTDNLSTASRAFPQLCSQSMSFNEANLGSGYASFGTHWAVDAEL